MSFSFAVPWSLSKRSTFDINDLHISDRGSLDNSFHWALNPSHYPISYGPQKYERRTDYSQSEDVVQESSNSDSEYEAPRHSASAIRSTGSSKRQQGTLYNTKFLRWYQLRPRSRGRSGDKDTEVQVQKQVKNQRLQRKQQKQQGSTAKRSEAYRIQQQLRLRQTYPNKGRAPLHTIVYRGKGDKRPHYYRLQPNTKIQAQAWFQDNTYNLQRRSGSEPPNPGDPNRNDAVPPAKGPNSQKMHHQKTATYKVNLGSKANQIALPQQKHTQQEARPGRKGPSKGSSSSKVGEQHIAQGVRDQVDLGYPTNIRINALLEVPIGYGAPVASKWLSLTRNLLHKQPPLNQRNRTGQDSSKSRDPSQKRIGPRGVHGKEPNDSPSSTSSPRPGTNPTPIRLGPPDFSPYPGHSTSTRPRLRPGPVRPPQGPQNLPPPIALFRPTIHGPFFPPDHFRPFKQVFRASDQPVPPLFSPGPLPKHGPLLPRPNGAVVFPPDFDSSLPIVPHPGLHSDRLEGSSHQSQKSNSVERVSSSESIEAPPSPSTHERSFFTYSAKHGKRRRRDE